VWNIHSPPAFILSTKHKKYIKIYSSHQNSRTEMCMLTRSHQLWIAVTHPAADSTSASKLFADPCVTFSEASFTYEQTALCMHIEESILYLASVSSIRDRMSMIPVFCSSSSADRITLVSALFYCPIRFAHILPFILN
jgi:hypothetical protein